MPPAARASPALKLRVPRLPPPLGRASEALAQSVLRGTLRWGGVPVRFASDPSDRLLRAASLPTSFYRTTHFRSQPSRFRSKIRFRLNPSNSSRQM